MTEKGDDRLHGLDTLTSLAVGVTIVVALYVGREVLVPIALAILLSFVLSPVVWLLHRARLGRVPAVFLAVALALAVILSVGGLIGMQISEVISDIPSYAITIDQKVASVRTIAKGQLSGILATLVQRLEQAGIPPPQPPPRPSARSRPGPASDAQDEGRKPMPVELRQPDATPIEIAQRILMPVVSPLATTGIVFIVAIFILLQQVDLRDRLIRLFGLLEMHRTTRALDDAARRLAHYLLTQLGLNAVFGLLIGIGLLLIGVPNPALWAALSMLFRFVPYIGAVLAALLPTTLAAAVAPGWGMAFACMVLFAVTETVMGQFVEPLAYGRSAGLSPLSVIIAAIFWTWMWGPIGLILSMPLTVCLVVLGRHVRQLEFLDVLMGDRPALTSVETFYQRILSSDADDAQEYAEDLLKDRPLSTLYDEVAIKVLHLAASDAERGLLSEALLARIQRSMSRLVDELNVFTDVVAASAKPRIDVTSGVPWPEREVVAGPAHSARIDPDRDELSGAWTGPAPVLCIAGGGTFDRAVADMLVQLLTKNGLGARAVPLAAVSREAIGSLDVSGVAMVCLCYLDASLGPSRLRYLVQRLRGIAPRAKILAGLWPEENAQVNGARLAAVVGVHYRMVSLRDGVNICLMLAREASLPAGAAPAGDNLDH
jgi:predicted PurR-regulated permease PerM